MRLTHNLNYPGPRIPRIYPERSASEFPAYPWGMQLVRPLCMLAGGAPSSLAPSFPAPGVVREYGRGENRGKNGKVSLKFGGS